MTGTVPLRVMVLDAWDAVTLDLPLSTSLGDLKREALARARVRGDPNQYLVKFRGAVLDDERSLQEAGVPANAPLIVLSRRRRPVR